MSESQEHGFIFQRKVYSIANEIILKHKTEIDSYYTAEYDIPPIQIKSFKYETSNPDIEFGDISKMINKKIPFILFLIGYSQNKDKKEVVFSDSIYISVDNLLKIKGDLESDMVQNWVENLKKFKKGEHHLARKWAHEIKKTYKTKTMLSIRPKIDSGKQRRFQCALKLKQIYELKNQNWAKSNLYNINSIISNPRKRNNN